MKYKDLKPGDIFAEVGGSGAYMLVKATVFAHLVREDNHWISWEVYEENELREAFYNPYEEDIPPEIISIWRDGEQISGNHNLEYFLTRLNLYDRIK